MYKLLVLQIKELMELQLSAYEIARRINVDPSVVQVAMEIIKGWST
jgi:hypothetical protein